MATLYVTEPGAHVEKEYRRLLVVKDDEVLLSVPLSQVSEVVLVGYSGVTTPALLALLDSGSGLTLVRRGGELRGRLRSAQAHNLPLRRRQYACAAQADFCLQISRQIVAAKLKNSRALLRRTLRGRRLRSAPQEQARGAQALGQIGQALQRLPAAASLDELRGLEGRGSKAYFSVLRLALRPELSFEKRTRRPPGDPANALLSLAYSLLTNCLFTACELADLDPYEGFYHADKYGRPALALDLVEEFRGIVADSVVLNLVNNRILQAKDFESQPGEPRPGVYLTRRGLRVFLEQFSRRLATPVFHPLAGRALSYQKIFEVQARSLRKAVEQGDPGLYRPFLVK
jgi:CRISPR-associated protein Cas1